MEVFIPITLFVCVAAVLILRPMTKRVGYLLETIARERSAPAQVAETPDARIVTLLEHISRRLDQMEERVDFTERLVASRNGEESPRPPLPLSRAGN